MMTKYWLKLGMGLDIYQETCQYREEKEIAPSKRKHLIWLRLFMRTLSKYYPSEWKLRIIFNRIRKTKMIDVTPEIQHFCGCPTQRKVIIQGNLFRYNINIKNKHWNYPQTVCFLIHIL